MDVERLIVVGGARVALKSEGARGGVEGAAAGPWCGARCELGELGGQGRAGSSVAEWHAASR